MCFSRLLPAWFAGGPPGRHVNASSVQQQLAVGLLRTKRLLCFVSMPHGLCGLGELSASDCEGLVLNV